MVYDFWKVTFQLGKKKKPTIIEKKGETVGKSII